MADASGAEEPAITLLVKWAEMSSRSRLEAAIRRWRLSSGQLMLLSTLRRLGPSSSAALSRALHLTPQAMTTLLKPLEDRALIDRAPDPANQRRVSIKLSDVGVALLQEMKPTTELVDARLVAAFSPAELAEFRSLLMRIAEPPNIEPDP